MLYDLIIIGAGPAGLSAAIYAARGQLKTLIFGDYTKGNLYKSHVIPNYFGFPDAPSGPELAKLGFDQALSFGAEHNPNQIVNIGINEDQTFTLKDNFKNLYHAKTLILATGQSFVNAGIKGEKEYLGKGVSYCVTCDGFFFKNKLVSIIGNADFAAEEAIYMSTYTPRIQILSHGKDFEINPVLFQELQQKSISLVKTARLREINGQNSVETVVATDLLEYPTQGVFIALGAAGANAFAQKLGLEMEGNYIRVDRNGQTNVPGIFAAGDCTGAPPQVATSVGNGCIAALSAIKLVRGLQTYIQYN